MSKVKNTECEIKQKRERNVNFTQKETELLVSLAESKKYIIENKKSDSATWHEKEEAWKDIEKKFNMLSKAVFRDHKHLKSKYEALKRDTRKKSAAAYESSDGTSTAPILTPIEQKVREMILFSGVKNESCYDSDLVSPSTSPTGPTTTRLSANENSFELPTEQTRDDSVMVLDIEPIIKTEYNELQEEDPPQYESDSTSQWNSTDIGTKNHCVLSKPKKRKLFDRLTKEKLEIAKIERKVITEELEQKLIRRKILEKEMEHKDAIHELEKQHLLLKIELSKKNLGIN